MKIIKDVIALRFKTSESEGVILHGEGQQGDYITLELRKAKLLLQINLGKFQIQIPKKILTQRHKTWCPTTNYFTTVYGKNSEINTVWYSTWYPTRCEEKNWDETKRLLIVWLRIKLHHHNRRTPRNNPKGIHFAFMPLGKRKDK